MTRSANGKFQGTDLGNPECGVSEGRIWDLGAFAIGGGMFLRGTFGTLTGDTLRHTSTTLHEILSNDLRACWKHACPNDNVDTNLFVS
jgi:hypothetical protein